MRVHIDRRMLKDRQAQEDLRCAECGYVSEHVTVWLGEAERLEWSVDGIEVCLPCLKRAVAEAEAAVAKDKA